MDLCYGIFFDIYVNKRAIGKGITTPVEGNWENKCILLCHHTVLLNLERVGGITKWLKVQWLQRAVIFATT